MKKFSLLALFVLIATLRCVSKMIDYSESLFFVFNQCQLIALVQCIDKQGTR